MASEWPLAKLSDIAAINPRRKVKKGELVPFVEMAALPVSGRDVPTHDIEMRIAKAAGSHFQNGDTLLARITPCLENGKTAQVSNLPDNVVGEGSTEFIVLCGHDPEDDDFIYYLSRSPDFRDFAIARMEGTSGRQRVAWQAIAGYQFTLPPPEIRRESAELLARLDDRIQSLRQANATLEAIAQALFKSWFVDFDPVRAKAEGREPEGMDAATSTLFPSEFEDSELGPIPKGWRVEPLASAFEINPKRAVKKGSMAKYLDMASVPTTGHVPAPPVDRLFSSGSKFTNGDTLFARITPCLENGKTAHVDFLGDGESAWGSTEFIVLRPNAPLPSYFGYLLVRQVAFRTFAIKAMSGTSGRQRVDLGRLGQFQLVVPEETVATRFGEIVEPLRQSISENAKRSETLASLRDNLLPRLISGKLRLPNIEPVALEAEV